MEENLVFTHSLPRLAPSALVAQVGKGLMDCLAKCQTVKKVAGTYAVGLTNTSSNDPESHTP